MVTKDPFVLLETLYLHSRSTWPHDSHLTYFSRYEPAGSSVSCSSLDALRVTGKQGSFYKNKGLARMCPGVGISFSCPSISHSGNRRPVAETLALREAAPGRTGAVFALESVLAGSSLLHGPYHLPAAVLEAKPYTSPSGLKPANKNKCSHLACSPPPSPGRSAGASRAGFFGWAPCSPRVSSPFITTERSAPRTQPVGALLSWQPCSAQQTDCKLFTLGVRYC